MGFLKTMLEKSEMKQTKVNILLKTDEPRCRKCNSENIYYTKHIGWGEKTGTVYHYKLNCKSCGTRYHVKRTKEIFDLIKGDLWIKSKSILKMELKQKLF